jgi:PAS domain S-box-containing protein
VKEQLVEEIERLRQEVAKLRQSEQKYRAILENVVEGYYEVDLAGNFTFVTNSICADIGYSRDELIGMNNRQYMDKETANKVYQTFSQVYITKETVTEFGFEVIRKNGTKLSASCSVSLIMDEKGQPLGFRGTIRNITEQKKAEAALRRSEEKYRTILENITDGYYEVDLAGNYTFFNDSMCQIVGYNRDEMMGMNNRQYMDKENARKVFQIFNKIYTTGKPDRGFDWELIRKDGTRRTVEASVSLIRNPQGEPAGFRGIVRDITERKQMEAERTEMERKTQLASRLSIIGEMASGMIHEINNPLTSVVGFAEILADKELPEDARDYATIINNEGKRVASIAGRLLNFARHQKPETVYTNINELIETTLELQTYEMTTGNIKVAAELDPHLPQIMADPGQLQQVFLNIMLNARTEMRAAHGGGNLLVKTQALDDTIRISFKDDGPGIPQENLKTIFNPFFTTKKTDEGTGLGLSICRGIISSHRGTIYAESTPGKGATFIIELPVVARQTKTARTAGLTPITFNNS